MLLRTVEIYTPGLIPQVNGLTNVLADTPNSALRFGKVSRGLLSTWLYLMGYSVGKVDPAHTDLEWAATLSYYFDDAITRQVRDPATRQRFQGINRVFGNTVNDKLNPNLPPTVAPVAAPNAGVEPVTVSFTGNAVDPDGSIVFSQWSFGDFTTSSALNPSHTYQCDGNYTATLEVADDRGAVTSGSVAVSVTSAGGPVSYNCDVQPVFNRVCTGCHGAARGLSLTTCENLQIGSSPYPNRKVVVPGDAANSRLYQRIISTTSPMPPIGGLIPLAEQNAIRDWINGLDPNDPNFCD